MANEPNQMGPQTTIAWYKVYLALTVVSTLILGFSRAGIPPFGELRPIETAGLIVALFAVTSVTYWYDVQR